MDTVPAEWRSDEKCDIDPNDSVNILKHISYYNKDPSYCLIWFPHDAITPLLTEPFERMSDAPTSSLEKLPNELLDLILESLDIQSLFKLRQTNVNIRKYLHSMTYGVAVRYGYILFCALFRLQFSALVSLSNFYKAMRTEACETCGKFSGFISIPVWKRCCYLCIQRHPELRMQSRSSAITHFRLTRAQQDELGSCRTLPGQYMYFDSPQVTIRYNVVSTHRASEISGIAPSDPGSPAQVRRYNYLVSCELPFYNTRPEYPRAERGLRCFGCEWGYMKNNEKSSELLHATERMFTIDGFLEHFSYCIIAQELWKVARAGGMEALPLLLFQKATYNGVWGLRDGHCVMNPIYGSQ